MLKALPETLTNFIGGGFWPLAKRIDLGEFLGVLDGRLGVAVDQEAAPEEEIAEGARAEDEVAVGHIAVVAGRQQQEFPALALVRAGVAHVADVVEPMVVNQAENVRRRLDDQRAVLESSHMRL